MEQNQYIVAIEIGSSKIVGALAVKSSSGVLSLTRLVEEKMTNCVRYGTVLNVENVKSGIMSILKDIEDFEKYLDVIPPTTILVFDYKYKKLDKRRALAKKIDKMGVLFESKKLYDNNIPGWIQNYLADKGYSITPKAMQMMADYLGTDLHKIRNELEKLIIVIPKSKKIDDDDVERNIGISKDFNVFELQNAIGRRDVVKANRIVNYFGDNVKENPLLVTAITLYGYFTKLLKVHYATDPSPNGLAAALGVSPFFVRDYQTAARNYSVADCVRCIAVLREFDLKSLGYQIGDVTAKDLYREMIFKLLH